MADILVRAAVSAKWEDVKAAAIDNLLLYLQTIVRDSGAEIHRFLPVLTGACEQMQQLPQDGFELVVRSFYSIQRLAGALLVPLEGTGEGLEPVNRLVAKYLEHTYRCWLSESDPQTGFDRDAAEMGPANAFDDLFEDISHRRIAEWRAALETIRDQVAMDSTEATRRLTEFPGFQAFVDTYKRIPHQLLQKDAAGGRGRHLKLIFLFQMMNISGLGRIHEETLREINQTLTWIIVNENYRNIQHLIRKTFSILKERSQAFPATALNCVLNMGKGVYKTDDVDLVNFFIDALIDFGFQAPMVQGVDDDWRIKVNSAHLQNIRTWMDLIKLNPKRSTRLLVCLSG